MGKFGYRYTVLYRRTECRNFLYIAILIWWLLFGVILCPLSPVYNDTTQLNSTRRRVELSCELSRFGHPLRRTTPIADGR